MQQQVVSVQANVECCLSFIYIHYECGTVLKGALHNIATTGCDCNIKRPTDRQFALCYLTFATATATADRINPTLKILLSRRNQAKY